jgi:lipoprotein-anchoring transpeptidase ErfK/SrfK
MLRSSKFNIFIPWLALGLLSQMQPASASNLAQELGLSAGQAIDLPVLPSPEFPTQPSPELLPLRLEIRLSRRQVTLYKGTTIVKAYPIAIGRAGWETPKGTFQVRQMIKNPAWVHPLEPSVLIPAGDPENPLGRFWIGFWTDGKNWIGFHGTPNPRSIGTAASHGCIRMYNRDIEELFQQVSLGTPVTVVQ